MIHRFGYTFPRTFFFVFSFFSTDLKPASASKAFLVFKSVKAVLSQFKFLPPFLENEDEEADETLRRRFKVGSLRGRATECKVSFFSQSVCERERGNHFERVLEGGGICPPTRRRALNGFLAGAVKRIKTRTDDEGGGPSLPKIRLCIKTLPP